jgi:hypothetical protein
MLRRNCFVKQVTEGKIAGWEAAGVGRHNQILNGLKQTRGYWKMKQKPLDGIFLETRYGRVYGLVARQTMQ